MLTRVHLATSQATTGLGLFCLQAGPLVSLIIVLNGSSEEPGAKATSRCGLGEGRPCEEQGSQLGCPVVTRVPNRVGE